MPRIALIDLGAAWGGQEIYSQLLGTSLAERGWRVSSFSPHERHATRSVAHQTIPIGFSEFPRLARELSRVQAEHDILHFNGIRAIYLSAVSRRMRPFVGTKHSPYGSTKQQTLKSRLALLGSRVVFHQLNWLISVSGQTLNELPSRVKRRSTIVLNGVPDLGTGHESVQDDDPQYTVCFVGRFVESKGLWRLLEAVECLHREGRAPRVLLAGGGPLDALAREFVAERGLSERVEFLGYVESPGSVFRRSHVCVLPSLHEGLPLSLLEAMSARCALVGHDIPGVRDVLRAEVNGVFADVSASALAAVLGALGADRARLGRLRSAARADYEQAWRLERMVDETEAIYRRAIAMAQS